MKKAVLELLDRPGGRRVLGWIATVYGRRNLEGFRVFYEDGVWIHQYPGPRFMAHEKIMVPKNLPSDPEDPAYYVHGDPSTFGQAIEDIGHYLPQPGDVVIDVGAGKGTLTAALAHLVGPEGTVLAVEAHPRQFRCLEAVCEYNGLEQVVPVNRAATDDEIELVIEDGGNPDENAVSTSGPGIRVEGTTLDHLIDVHDIEVVDLLCMNIEGAERQAVSGMARSVGKDPEGRHRLPRFQGRRGGRREHADEGIRDRLSRTARFRHRGGGHRAVRRRGGRLGRRQKHRTPPELTRRGADRLASVRRSAPRFRRVAAVLAVALLAAACGDSAAEGGDASATATADWSELDGVDVEALAFTGTATDGTTFSGADVVGQDVLLWFWAPW